MATTCIIINGSITSYLENGQTRLYMCVIILTFNRGISCEIITSVRFSLTMTIPVRIYVKIIVEIVVQIIQ